MKATLYLWTMNVKMFPFRQLGYIFALGKSARHCCVCWETSKGAWRAEMIGAPGEKSECIGRGLGYSIFLSPMERPVGERIGQCESAIIETVCRAYGSTINGNPPSFWTCGWNNYPNGYGGPALHTCNTYARWILEASLSVKVDKPRGAVGWKLQPRFPYPKNSGIEE